VAAQEAVERVTIAGLGSRDELTIVRGVVDGAGD
jgi:hypothetical protein